MSAFLDYTTFKLQRIKSYLVNSTYALTPRMRSDLLSACDEIHAFRPSPDSGPGNLPESYIPWAELHELLRTNLEAQKLTIDIDDTVVEFGLTKEMFLSPENGGLKGRIASHAIGQCTISIYENLSHYHFEEESAQYYFTRQFSGLGNLRNACGHAYRVSHPFVHEDNPYNAAKHWGFVKKRKILLELLESSFCSYVAMLPEVFRRDMENWEAEWKAKFEEETNRRAEEEEKALWSTERWDQNRDQEIAAGWTSPSETTTTTSGSEDSEWGFSTPHADSTAKAIEPVTSDIRIGIKIHRFLEIVNRNVARKLSISRAKLGALFW